MLQEAFNLSSTQTLSLYALGAYLATRPQLTVSEIADTETPDVVESNDPRTFLFIDLEL